MLVSHSLAISVFLYCFTLAVQASELEKYISVYADGSVLEQTKASQTLEWSGITDTAAPNMADAVFNNNTDTLLYDVFGRSYYLSVSAHLN